LRIRAAICRAVEARSVEVAVQTDGRLPNGVILLDDNTRIPLKKRYGDGSHPEDGLITSRFGRARVEHASGRTKTCA